jgi:hypothetical protein
MNDHVCAKVSVYFSGNLYIVSDITFDLLQLISYKYIIYFAKSSDDA